VSPRTVERAGEFVQGLDTLKAIREDLPRVVVAKRSHQATLLPRQQTRQPVAVGPRSAGGFGASLAPLR
jgi:hypothetical protein